MFLRVTLFILNILGLSPLTTGIFQKVRLVIFCLSLTFAFLGSVLGGIQFYQGQKTVARLSDGLPGLFQAAWKAGVLISRRRELAEAIRSVSTFWKSDILRDELQSDVEFIPRVVSRGLAGYYVYTLLVCILFYTTPYIQRSPELPLIFIMEGVKPYHNYMYIYQLYFSLPLAYSAVVFEGLFIFYVASMIKEYRIIRHVFDGKTKVPISFVENVEHHCSLISFVKKISDIYQYTFMTMILTTFMYICFGLFLMTQNGFPPSPDDISKYSSIIGIASLQIAIYCFIGQLLVDESLKITDVFFYKDWLAMQSYQNAFGRMMVMRMSQKGQRLSVGGYFPLDLGAYTWMMKNVVSFFTFMQALSRKQ